MNPFRSAPRIISLVLLVCSWNNLLAAGQRLLIEDYYLEVVCDQSVDLTEIPLRLIDETGATKTIIPSEVIWRRTGNVSAAGVSIDDTGKVFFALTDFRPVAFQFEAEYRGTKSNPLTVSVLAERPSKQMIADLAERFDRAIFPQTYALRTGPGAPSTGPTYAVATDLGHLHSRYGVRFEVHVKLMKVGTAQRLFHKDEYAFLGVAANGLLESGVFLEGSWQRLQGSQRLAVGTWYRVGMSYDCRSKMLSLHCTPTDETSSDEWRVEATRVLEQPNSPYLPANLNDVFLGCDSDLEHIADALLDDPVIAREDAKTVGNWTFNYQDARDHSGYKNSLKIVGAQFEPGYSIGWETIYNDNVHGNLVWLTGGTFSCVAKMLEQTHDSKHVAKVFTMWDRIVARRDDRRGVTVEAGVSMPEWRQVNAFTAAQAVFNDTSGRPALKVIAIRAGTLDGATVTYAADQCTIAVEIAPSTVPDRWDVSLTHRMAGYQSPEIYRAVSLNHKDQDFVETRINGLSRIIAVKCLAAEPATQLTPVIPTTLIPLSYSEMYADFFLLKGAARFALAVRNEPLLMAQPAIAERISTMVKTIEETVLSKESQNGKLYLDFRFDEGRGTIAQDISGATKARNDGQLLNGVTWVAGPKGVVTLENVYSVDRADNSAVHLDAARDQWIHVAADPSHGPRNGNLYFEAWIRPIPDEPTTALTIASRSDTWEFAWENGRILARVRLDGAWCQFATAEQVAPAGEFSHLRVTVSDIDHAVHFFLNGRLTDSIPYTGSMDLDTARELAIGARLEEGGSGSNFNGDIAELRVGDLNWYRDTATGGRYLRLPKGLTTRVGDGVVGAYNHMAMRAVVYRHLFKLTHQQRYALAAQEIAMYLHAEFTPVMHIPEFPSSTAYYWHYFVRQSEAFTGFRERFENEISYYSSAKLVPESKTEDLHLPFDTEFMTYMVEEGWVFTQSDLVRVLRCVRDEMAAPVPEADGSIKLGDFILQPRQFAYRNVAANLFKYSGLVPGTYGLLRNQLDSAPDSAFAISELVELCGQLP